MADPYTFNLSPEWPIEVTEEALKRAEAYPHGPLLPSPEAKVRLLRAALYAEEARFANG